MPIPTGWHYVKGSAGREVVNPDGEVVSKRQALNVVAQESGWRSWSGFSDRNRSFAYRALASKADIEAADRSDIRSEFNRRMAFIISGPGVYSKDNNYRKDEYRKQAFKDLMIDLGLEDERNTQEAWFQFYKRGYV